MPSEVFWKVILRNLVKFTAKYLRQSFVLIKLQASRFWHRCFPVNFAKFLRKPFLQNSFRRLLCFQIHFEFPNLGFVFSKSRRVFAILHCACDLILRSFTIFNSRFLKNFKKICILKFKARLKHKESY